MQKSLFAFLSVLVLLMLLVSCSPYRQLDSDEYLLHKNIIAVDKPELKEGIKPIIKQKANRRILGVFRFHLAVYSLGNRGKPTRFKNWLKNTVGEEPVILDTLFTNKSTAQIKQYMTKHGYFDAEVSDTTLYKKKKAIVKYKIISHDPSYITSVVRQSSDPNLDSIVKNDSAGSKLKAGIIYNENILQDDRERLTKLFRNAGYFEFTQQFISYRVFTSDTSRNVAVYQDIAAFSTADSTVNRPHTRYYINRIIYNLDYDPLNTIASKFNQDTIDYKGYLFVKPVVGRLPVKPEVIVNHTFMRPGNMFRQINADNTYKSLNLLGMYRFVNISYQQKDSNQLDCFINLGSTPKQEYKTELEGTNNGGNLGVAGDFTYRNRNVFRGAEMFEFKVRGALESQKQFTEGEDNKVLLLFNTYELGVENSIYLPKAIKPFKRFFKNKASNPVTVFSTNYNTQNRPEFNRSILDFSASLEWRKGKYIKQIVTPFQMNFVNVKLEKYFQDKLESLNDPVLYSSYDNHLITNGRYSFIYNNQRLNEPGNFTFFRTNFEFAGNTLYAYSKLNKLSKDNNDSYRILNKRFAQYFRPDADIRYYFNINSHNTIVYRIAAGIAIAYGNSKIIPFEKSFYAGGSNDLRAFRARNVGPGNFSSTNNFERTGDIKINGNVEYRFDILKILKGAFFLDAGNIWLRKQESSRPEAEFDISKFYRQLAVGSGLGFRFDFTFFIFRLDIGVPVVDPQYTGQDKIVVDQLKPRSLVYNFGIGYPF
jgi:outer membrane protein assembly factor BamA